MNAEVATAIAWHTHPVKTAKDLYKTELVIAAGGATDICAHVADRAEPAARHEDQDRHRLCRQRGPGAGAGARRGRRDRRLQLRLAQVGAAATGSGRRRSTSCCSTRSSRIPICRTCRRCRSSRARRRRRTILSLIFEPQQMGRPIFGPPGIPADRLKALRDAFEAFVKDLQVLAESAEDADRDLQSDARREHGQAGRAAAPEVAGADQKCRCGLVARRHGG